MIFLPPPSYLRWKFYHQNIVILVILLSYTIYHVFVCEIQEIIIIAINGINTKYEDIKSKLEKINEKIVALENEELEKKT